jgi:hypothetical protein
LQRRGEWAARDEGVYFIRCNRYAPQPSLGKFFRQAARSEGDGLPGLKEAVSDFGFVWGFRPGGLQAKGLSLTDGEIGCVTRDPLDKFGEDALEGLREVVGIPDFRREVEGGGHIAIIATGGGGRQIAFNP